MTSALNDEPVLTTYVLHNHGKILHGLWSGHQVKCKWYLRESCQISAMHAATPTLLNDNRRQELKNIQDLHAASLRKKRQIVSDPYVKSQIAGPIFTASQSPNITSTSSAARCCSVAAAGKLGAGIGVAGSSVKKNILPSRQSPCMSVTGRDAK